MGEGKKNPFKYSRPTTSTVEMSALGVCSAYCTLMRSFCTADVRGYWKPQKKQTFEQVAGGLVTVSPICLCAFVKFIVLCKHKNLCTCFDQPTVQVMPTS